MWAYPTTIRKKLERNVVIKKTLYMCKPNLNQKIKQDQTASPILHFQVDQKLGQHNDAELEHRLSVQHILKHLNSTKKILFLK